MKIKDIIYLDTNIFVTFYLERNGFDKVSNFFEDNKNLEVKFVTSDWTLTEIVKVLRNEYKEKPKRSLIYNQTSYITKNPFRPKR